MTVDIDLELLQKGFSQIPGKDHQENHAPVIHDTTFHMVLCFKLYYKLHKKAV